MDERTLTFVGGTMLKRRSPLAACLLLLVFAAARGQAADDPAVPESVVKAIKYHTLLAKRPEPGFLFDRFYNTWLDESTVDSLEAFLLERVKSSNQTGDRLLLAFFYVKKGDDVTALDQFRQALADNPASAATWYHKALVEARTLDFDLAIADLKKARAQKPDEKLAIQIDKQLGKLLARNRQTAEAVKVWQALLNANPTDEELNEDLIELHIEEGLFKEAAQLQEQLVGRTKDEYLAVTRRLRLGDIYHRAGDRGKAIETYTAALEAVGGESWLEREILAQIDQVYRREDDLAGLKKLYDDLLKKYAKRISIRRRYAQMLVETGEHEPAVAAYREILKLTPGERATREEYIGMLTRIGKPDEALKELAALCDQFPKDAELKFRLASTHQEAKQAEPCVAAVGKYLEASDGSEYAFLRGARLLERLETKDAAAKLYEKMAAKFADSSAAQEAYAAFLYSSGKKEEAIERWRKLAQGGDLAQTLQVARTLSARTEHAAALELLQARIADIQREPLFLGQLVTTALALKKYDEAIPWAIERVQLAEAAPDLEAAIDQAAMTIEHADKLDEQVKKLEAMPKRSVAESCLLAELLERGGDSQKSDNVLKQAADGGNLLALSQQVRLYSQRREWTHAAEATRKILKLPGGLKSLHVRRLVELYQRDYQLEEGLKWVEEWKRLSPGSTLPWVTEARMLQALGKTEDALKVLRAAALKFQEDEDLRVRLAEFYAESEKPVDAMRIYWQLYEETEDIGGKLRWAQSLASIAQQQGTVQQLVQDFEERVRSNRQSIVPLLALSEVYREVDDYEGRRRALTAAAKVKPDDMYLLHQVARAEEQEGDWQAAVATLERAAAGDKTNRTREQIARLYLNYGDAEKGYSILFDLVGAPDADPRTLETTADALCATQEWERAADFLTRRLPDHPADYRLRYLAAVALEEAGRGEEAARQFTQLLSNQEELPTKKPQAAGSQSQVSGYFDIYRKLLPTEAFEWMQLMQQRYPAYAYRQQRYGSRVVLGAAPGGQTRSMIQMPPDVDSVRPLALCHLLSIALTLGDAEQELVSKDLEAAGVKHPKALMQLDPNRGDFTSVLPEILEKNPKDEAVLALLVIQQMGVRNDALAPHCVTALEVFRKSHPELALMAAIQAGVHEAVSREADDEAEPTEKEKKAEPANKYLDEALAIGSSLEHPNPMTVMSLTVALGGRNLGNNQDLPISEAYRQKLSRLLVKWYPEMVRVPQFGPWAFYASSQSLAQNSDPTEYMAFLDEEVSRYQSGGKGAASGRQMQSMMPGHNPGKLLEPLTFPPPILAEFPAHVLAQFSTDGSQNPFGMVDPNLADTEEFAKKIRPHLDQVKSPVLRILLAQRAELEDVVEDAVKKLLAAKTPQLDSYLLGAGWAATHEKPAEAVRLLEKARYLPMKQEVRKAVDGAIVAAVLAEKSAGKELPAELLEAGQQASLRLRRSRLDSNQRTALVAAMEELGLKKEAEKLDAAATASAPAASVRSSYTVAVQRTSNDHVAKLIDQGKRDAAVKQLAVEVSGNVRNIIGNPQNQRYQRQQFREVKQRVEAYGLVEDVLKSLAPGDSKNSQKITEYAVANQLFGREKEARAALENALAIKPKDDSARLQLIILLAPNDPGEAAKQLGQLSKPSRLALGEQLSESLQDYEASYDERLSYAALAVELLKTMQEGDLQQSYWVENLLQYLGRYMHSRRGSLPSIYSVRNPSEDSNEAKGQKGAIARRRKIHQEICEQLLSMPDQARSGFRHWLAVTEAAEEPTDEFASRAEKILLDEAAAKPRPGTAQHSMYYNSSETEVRFRTPEEFLARRAWKSGDWKLIDETLLPKLAAAKTRESRERLHQMATLYRCDEAEFLDKASEITKASRPSPQQGQSNDGMAIAVDVWADRELKVDMQPLVLKQLKQEIGMQNHYQPPGFVLRFVEGVSKRWDRTKQLALLEEVATLYIGPPEKRNEFVKKYFNRQSINWGTPNGRIYVYSQLMEQLCQRKELVFTVLEHLDQYDDPKPVSNFEYRVNALANKTRQEGVEATIELLETSPWLADLEKFRSLSTGGRNRGESPLATLLGKNARQGDFRKKLRSALEKRQAEKPTFGGQLLLASLEEAVDSPAVLECIGQNLEAIQSLPEKQQNDLSALVIELSPAKAENRKDLSAAAKAALAWVNGSRVSESRSLIEKLANAKRLEDIGIEYGQADEFVRTELVEIIRTDTPAAVKAFLRLAELAREAQKRGEWHIQFGDGTTIDGYLLRTIGYTNNDSHDWKTYNFVVDVMRHEPAVKIETGYNISQVLRSIVNNHVNKVGHLPDGAERPYVDRIKLLYNQAGEALDGRPSSLLIAPLYDRLNGRATPADCEGVLKWVTGEMSSGKYPQIAADLHAIYSLIAIQKAGEANKEAEIGKPVALADFHARFRTIFADDALPLTWRLNVAEFLAARQQKKLPLELSRDIAKLYTAALAEKAPIMSDQHTRLTDVVYSLLEDTDARETLDSWRIKWADRYLRAVPPRTSRTAGAESTYELSSSTAIIGALRLYLAAGDVERAKTLVRKFSSTIGHLPQTTAVLVRAEQPEEAARVLRGGWPRLELVWPNEPGFKYDAEIEHRLPAMLEKLQRDDERYLARVLFASMPDPKSPTEGRDTPAPPAPTTRDERLGKLADEFARIEFQNPNLKKLCLVMLSGSDVSGQKIAQELAAAFDPKSVLLAFANDDSTRLMQETRLAKCHFGNQLRAGETAAFVDLLTRLSANPGDHDYQFDQAVGPFIDCAVAALKDKNCKPWTADQCATVSEVLRGLLKDRQYVNFNDYRGFHTLLVALTCYADQQQGWNEWTKTVSEYARNQMQNSGLSNDIWRFGLALTGPATPENLDARLQYFRAVSKLAYDKKWITRGSASYRLRGQNDRNYLTVVAKSGLLSAEELKSRGPEVLKDIGPKNERTYGRATLANWLQSNKEYESAAEIWRSIAVIDPEAKKIPRNEANYRLGLAVCLKNLKRFEEAREALKVFEGKEFDKDLKGSRDEYLREIEAAAKAASSGDKEESPAKEKSAAAPQKPRVLIPAFFATVTEAATV